MTKAPRFDLVSTYHVTLGPEQQTVITWGTVGKVNLTTELGDSWDSQEGSGGTAGWAAGGKGLVARNTGSVPVIVATGEEWPNQGTVVNAGDSEAFGLVGELVNQDVPRDGLVVPLAIMSGVATSATGFFAIAGEIDQSGTARLTVSLHLQG